MSQNNNILVTGGSGFIGRSLVFKLVSEGYIPTVFDNNFRGDNKILFGSSNSIKFIKGDIRDKSQVLEAAKGCSAIFHLAFINGTKYFYEQPDLVLDVGVKGAINTLEVAKDIGIEKYILASSSEVYQKPEILPTTEDAAILIPDVTNPRYSYAGGKIISELLTLNYLRETDIQHAIFRPHNIFGPQMGFEHVIPELIRKIFEASNIFKDDECSIEIQGTGKETRAFCYVEDAVDQIMYIFLKGKNKNIYHVGMNEEISINQLIKDISNILKIKIRVEKGDLRKGGTDRRCPSIEKISSLGYIKKNSYHKGLINTVKWYKNFYKKNI